MDQHPLIGVTTFFICFLFLSVPCFLSVPFTRRILLQIKLPGKDIICYCIKSRCAGHAEDGGEQHIILNRLNGVLRIADKRRGVTAYGEIHAADNLHYHIDNKVRDYSPEDSVFPEQVTKRDRAYSIRGPEIRPAMQVMVTSIRKIGIFR